VDLTGAQRPLLPSSDVEVSINDLQKPARKFDRLIQGVEKNTQQYHYENSERINPIFCMKSGIIGRHVVSFFSPVERITTRAQVARVQNAGDGRLKRTSPMLDSLPPFGSLGAPTERCLSKIAHWNDRASRGVDTP
jgi:hypothetical protein